MSKLFIILITLIIIFFTIGLSLFLCGCHDIIRPKCYNYIKKEVVISEYNTDIKKCTVCANFIETSDGKLCEAFKYYDCYSPKVVFKVNFNGIRFCNEFFTQENFEDKSKAIEAAKKLFPYKSKYFMYVDINTFECKFTSQLETFAIAGLTILLLCGIIFIVLIVLLVMKIIDIRVKKKENEINHHIQDNQKEINYKITTTNSDQNVISRIKMQDKYDYEEVYEIKPSNPSSI